MLSFIDIFSLFDNASRFAEFANGLLPTTTDILQINESLAQGNADFKNAYISRVLVLDPPADFTTILNQDIIIQICWFLNPKSIVALSCVNKMMQNSTLDYFPSVYSCTVFSSDDFWQRLCFRLFGFAQHEGFTKSKDLFIDTFRSKGISTQGIEEYICDVVF